MLAIVMDIYRSCVVASMFLVAGCSFFQSEVAILQEHIVWQVNPASIPADGSTKAQLHGTISDVAATSQGKLQAAIEIDAPGRIVNQESSESSDNQLSAFAVCDAPGVARIRAFGLTAGGKVYFAQEANLVCSASAGTAAAPDGSAAILEPPKLAFVAPQTTAAADNEEPTLFTLVVTDALGQPLANQAVTLEPLRSGDTVAPQMAVSDSEGKVVISLGASTLGEGGVRARSGGIEVVAPVRFTSGPPDVTRCLFFAQSDGAVANGFADIVFEGIVRDAQGLGVPYAPVLFVSSQKGDVLTPPVAQTNAQGRVSVALRGTVAGLRKVRLVTHDGYKQVDATLVAGSVTSASSTLVVAPHSVVADAITPTSIALAAKDALGNRVQGANVLLSSSIGSDVIDNASGTTAADGSYVASVRCREAGSHVLWAAVSGVALSAPFTCVPGPVDFVMSSLIASPQNSVVNGTTPISVTLSLKDALNNIISGQTVSIAASGSSNSFSATGGTTDTAGQWQTTLLSTKAESKTLTATAAGIDVLGSVVLLPGDADAAQSTLTALPATLVADESAMTTVSLTLMDAFGNTVPGQSVVFGNPGPRFTLSATNSTTDAAGQATTTIKSDLAGMMRQHALVASLDLNVPISFLAGSANATLSVLTIAPTEVLADGNAAITLSAQLYDRFGNPVSDSPVLLTASGAATLFNPPTGSTTSSTGFFISQATSNVVQSGHITLVASGLSLSENVTFIAGPPSALHSTLSANPGSGLIAHQSNLYTVTATVRDAQMHPLPSINVLFYPANAASILSTSRLLTSAGGTAQTAVGSKFAGPRQIFAQIENFTLNRSISFTANGNAPVESFLGCRQSSWPLPAGTYILSIEAADMDNDGLSDIVAMRSSSLEVYINQENGTFAAPLSSALPSTYPEAIKIKDLNGDGFKDVLVVREPDISTSPGFDIFEGSGNSPLLLSQTIDYPNYFYAVCLGDINTDGFPDIVVPVDPGYAIYFGQASGSYGSPTLVSLPKFYFDCSIKDINLDGHLDIVMSTYPYPIPPAGSSLDFFAGSGDGNFVLANVLQFDAIASFLIGNFNSDGWPDLAVTNDTSTQINIILASGNGNFFTPIIYDMKIKSPLVTLIDNRADGQQSLIVGNYQGSSNFSFLNNLGEGSFAPPLNNILTNEAECVAFADFDQDGYGDLAYYTSSQTLGVDYAMGHGRWSSANAFRSPRSGEDSVLVSSDFDLDGNLDLVSSGNSTINVWRGVGDGNFLLQNVLEAPVGSFDHAVVGDFDGDGKSDFYIHSAYSQDQGLVSLNLGGNFLLKNVVSTTTSNYLYASLCSGDLNLDGLDDVVASVYGPPDIVTLLADGSINIFNPSSQPVPSGSNRCGRCAVADVDLDGKMDIVTACDDLTIYLGRGDGTFAAPKTFGSAANKSFFNVAVADFNEDGFSDVAASDSSENDVYLFVNDGSGDFAAAELTLSGSGNPSPFGLIKVADFNGDGHSDLIMTSAAYLSLYNGRGDGTFSPERKLYASGIYSFLVDDFDKNGFDDLIYSHYAGVVFMSRDFTAPAAAVPSVSLSDLSVQPASAPATGTGFLTYHLTLKDAHGYLIPNKPINATLTLGDGATTSLMPLSATTSPVGTWALRVKSTSVERKVITLHAEGVSLSAESFFTP